MNSIGLKLISCGLPWISKGFPCVSRGLPWTPIWVSHGAPGDLWATVDRPSVAYGSLVDTYLFGSGYPTNLP